MEHFKLLLLALFINFLSNPVQAQSSPLFYESCSLGKAEDVPYYLKLRKSQYFMLMDAENYRGPILSCQNIKQYGNAYELVGLILTPAILALNNPSVKAGLALELARLGLTAANPAILGVTVIGAGGVVIFRMIMKQKMEDCARMEKEELKNQIITELRKKYNLQQNSSINLNILSD